MPTLPVHQLTLTVIIKSYSFPFSPLPSPSFCVFFHSKSSRSELYNIALWSVSLLRSFSCTLPHNRHLLHRPKWKSICRPDTIEVLFSRLQCNSTSRSRVDKRTTCRDRSAERDAANTDGCHTCSISTHRWFWGNKNSQRPDRTKNMQILKKFWIFSKFFCRDIMRLNFMPFSKLCV